MIILNPLLNKSYFIASFVSGLKSEMVPLVRLANPTSLVDAYEAARMYEKSFQALAKHNSHRPFSSQTRPYNPNQLTYQRTLVVIRLLLENTPLIITYPNQRIQAPCKPNNIEALRGQGL